jgi:hypothetical protein
VHFYSFAIISPWRRDIPFVWAKMNSLDLRKICAKSGYNWPSGSWEDVENVKVYRRTDGPTDRRTTDKRRSEKLSRAFSSGELKRQNLLFLMFDYFLQVKNSNSLFKMTFSMWGNFCSNLLQSKFKV